MDEKLTQSLREAGFVKDWHSCYSCGEGYGGDEYEITSYPTLGELIEAFDGGFRVLEYFPGHAGTDSAWFATGVYERQITQTNAGTSGGTPEEAVAKLWLSLRKNEQG